MIFRGIHASMSHWEGSSYAVSAYPLQMVVPRIIATESDIYLDNDFRITFLGTSCATLLPFPYTSACLIEVGETKIMVDAGIGALRQLRRAGVDPDMLDAVLMTHWHLDHFAGLQGLIHARTGAPLPVLGPEPGRPTHLLLRAMCPAALRNLHTVAPGEPTRIRDIRMEPVDTVHRIASVGWKLDEAAHNRRLVISGDTRPSETVIEAARGADLLVHEATYLQHHSSRAVKRHHSTAAEAAALALESEVGGLVLTHTSSRYTMKRILTEAVAVFPGTLVVSPLTAISIGRLLDESKKIGHGWAQLTVQPAFAA